MSLNPYDSVVSRPLTDILGDYSVSILGYEPDLNLGTIDAGPVFTSAIAKLKEIGGKKLLVPRGTYNFETPFTLPSGTLNIVIEGEGDSSLLTRGADIISGSGWVDLLASEGVRFTKLKFDGNIATFTGIEYGTFITDPVTPQLADNTTVRIHGGSSNIVFDDCTFEHAGGYTSILDATSDGDVDGVTYFNCRFINNRPHAFGLSGDLNYGSWTGGLLAQGDGTTYCVKNFAVIGCTFKRMTGNCIWSHLYAFSKLHQNMSVSDCTFEDIGRDGVLIGGVLGGTVSNNRFRRVGYMTSDDSSPSIPKWLNGQYAVAIDTSGLCMGVNYTGNSGISCNGAFMDLDGFCNGIVSGNSCRTPFSTDPEYVEDQIATANWAGRAVSVGSPGDDRSYDYGLQVSNTSNNQGGERVTVVGNHYTNMSGGAIRMFASRYGTICGNTIHCPDSPAVQPIVLGNIGTSDTKRSYGNTVCGNNITYNPGSSAPIVYESTNPGAPGGPFPFDPTDRNLVYDNPIISSTGLAFEFLKDPDTASTLQSINREGKLDDSTAVMAWYLQDGTTAYQHMRLQGFRDVGERCPLLNVSEIGVGGVISTGGRTTSIFADSVNTGKLYGDAFMVLTDATYSDVHANLLNQVVGGGSTGVAVRALFRYKGSVGYAEQSITITSGTRNWIPLGSGGSGSVAGSDKQIQFNDGGVMGASSNLIFHKTDQILTVAGKTGFPSILAVTSYIQSGEGFLTTSIEDTAIQAPLGGMVARQLALNCTIAYTPALKIPSITLWDSAATARARVANMVADGRLSMTANVYWNGTAWARDNTGGTAAAVQLIPTGSNTTTSFAVSTFAVSGAENFLMSGNGMGNLGIAGAASSSAGVRLTVAGVSTVAAIVATGGFIQSAEGFYTDSTSFQAIQAPLGGMLAQSLILKRTISGTDQAIVTMYDPAVTARTRVGNFGANGILSYSSNISWNGSAWVRDNNSLAGCLVQQLPVSTNTDTCFYVLPFNTSGSMVFALLANPLGNIGLGATPSSTSGQTLTVAGVGGQAGIAVTGGFIQSAQGFLSAGTATTTVNIASGGITAKYVIANTSYTQIGDTAGNAGLSGAGYGRIYYDSTSQKFRVSQNGGAYVDLIGAAGGVTSLNGLTGVLTVSGTTNQVNTSIVGSTIFLSTPQNLHTSAGPTFFSVTCNVFNSTSTGTNVTYQNANSNFIVNGNGVVSCQQVNVGGNTMINGSGQFVGTAVNVTGAVQSQATGTNVAFQTSAPFNFIVNGNGVVSCQTVNVGGISVINSSQQIVANGYNITGGFSGQTWTITVPGGFTIGGFGGTFFNMFFRGGILVSAS